MHHLLDSLPMRTIQGVGSVAQLGAAIRELGRRPLVVTDRGIVAAGLVAPVAEALRKRGLDVAVHDAVRENPTTEDVTQCVASARAHGADVLVGFGGGSSMDCAKGCNFILTNGGEMRDYLGRDRATRPMLPFVAVPTTAGTGSECQRFALISDPVTHRKMACGDVKTRARLVVLDPELTLTQPRAVMACTGVDAVAHALETAVTKARSAASDTYSMEAFRLLAGGLPRVWSNPGDIDARSDVQLGAALAGAAIEESMLGAAHAAANPLTASIGTTHGQAVGLMLPPVLRMNGRDLSCESRYAECALTAGVVDDVAEPSTGARALANWVEELLRRVGLKTDLAGLGVRPQDLRALAEDAAAQWTATFNPVAVSASDFLTLYEEVLTC